MSAPMLMTTSAMSARVFMRRPIDRMTQPEMGAGKIGPSSGAGPKAASWDWNASIAQLFRARCPSLSGMRRARPAMGEPPCPGSSRLAAALGSWQKVNYRVDATRAGTLPA